MFEVGDRVWSCNFGWGEVIKFIREDTFSVKVKFEDYENLYSYTKNGVMNPPQLRTLFFEEITIPQSALKRPKWRANVGCAYWFVSEFGEVIEAEERDYGIDNSRFVVGNYFKTMEEAGKSKIYKAFHGDEYDYDIPRL